MYFHHRRLGGPRRVYAAIKFVLFTMFGSLLMLVALLYVYFQYQSYSGEYTFDLMKIIAMPQLGFQEQIWLFGAFALAFAIKVPLFPFHTWLPDAHVQAPTVGSVILAGVLLKMGIMASYAFACRCSRSDRCLHALYLCARSYRDHLRCFGFDGPTRHQVFVAFSSVSHMGFVMLGLFAFNMQGLEGGFCRC